MSRLKTLSTITITIAIFISACGAEAVPTINAVDVQNTAVAGAFTLVAQTQAAIPTITPLPPTETPTQTPLPTDTPLASPTLEVTFTPASASNPGGDPCNAPLSGTSGAKTTVRIANETGQPIAMWFYLSKTPFGECGYASIPPLAKGSDYFLSIPQGCYAAGAWTTGDKKFTIDNVRYPLCANNSDKWTLHITRNEIYLTPP